MEAIHILPGVYGLEDLGLGYVTREWSLDQDAVEPGVFVQEVDPLQQLFLGDSRRESHHLGFDSDLGGGPPLGIDVDARSGIFPH